MTKLKASQVFYGMVGALQLYDTANFKRDENVLPLEKPVALKIDFNISEDLIRNFQNALAREVEPEQQIRSFGRLKPNWDSYGAGPIGNTPIENALKAIKVLREHSLIPSRISPTGDDSILFEISQEGTDLLFEFFESGEIGVLKKTPEQKTLVEITIEQFEGVLSHIVEHVQA